jgi:hypothetical protein
LDRTEEPQPSATSEPRHFDEHDVIAEAVDLIRVERRVPIVSAYTILVQAAVDARSTVHEAARLIVERSRGPDPL